jgi:hypothetical protein
MIEVDGQDVRPFRECECVASDTCAEVDNQPGSESPRFVPGDGLGGCLFDTDRVNPHA